MTTVLQLDVVPVLVVEAATVLVHQGQDPARKVLRLQGMESMRC
jgi:hypothetical protein